MRKKALESDDTGWGDHQFEGSTSLSNLELLQQLGSRCRSQEEERRNASEPKRARTPLGCSKKRRRGPCEESEGGQVKDIRRRRAPREQDSPLPFGDPSNRMMEKKGEEPHFEQS